MQEKAEIKAETQPASAALARTADALSCVEARLRLVEDAISHVVGHLRSLGATDIYEFQELDVSLQEIAALAGFTRSLAADMPQSWSLDLRDAANAINLDALRLRVLGGVAEPAPEAATEGELELF